MRIAQVAPLYESCPPQLYGGTERVVSYLTEELVRQGHEVTLFASGDSQTAATLRAGCERALRLDSECRDPLAHHLVMLHRVACRADDFDIIHFLSSFPAVRGVLGTDADNISWPPRPAGSRAHHASVWGDAVGLDLECAAHSSALGELVRHGIPWAADEPLRTGLRRRRLSRLHRSDLPGEAAGLGNRDRPTRRAAADDRGKGRQSRSLLLQNQDQAASQGPADLFFW